MIKSTLTWAGGWVANATLCEGNIRFKGPQGHITVFRGRLENTGWSLREELTALRHRLSIFPSCQWLYWCWWVGRWRARPGDGNSSLKISDFILTVGEEHTLLPKPAGFGYVGNILFLQGRWKIPIAKDHRGQTFCSTKSVYWLPAVREAMLGEPWNIMVRRSREGFFFFLMSFVPVLNDS